MNKRIVFGTLAAVALVLAACGTSGDKPIQQETPRVVEPLPETKFKYEQNNDGGITITGYLGGEEDIRDFIIPAQIGGINVTEIGARAFYYSGPRQTVYGQRGGSGGNTGVIMTGRGKFENVTIPPTVVSIGFQAFYNRAIKTLILPEGLQFIGAEAFSYNILTSRKFPAIGYVAADAFANAFAER
jgi:hypothetical protein